MLVSAIQLEALKQDQITPLCFRGANEMDDGATPGDCARSV